MSESVKKLKVYTKLLPCSLTDHELLNYGSELASITQDIATEENRQVGVKQELKSRIANLESRLSEIASKVARKEEYRDVEVEPIIDFKRGVYSEVRFDTGEVIFERPINEHERQEQMALADKE